MDIYNESCEHWKNILNDSSLMCNYTDKSLLIANNIDIYEKEKESFIKVEVLVEVICE